jgi:glycosyltransferase involved in cell wall biosynthesis
MPTKTADPDTVHLSVAMITLNEEQKLEKCLRSASFADEIIIVDSGSTDATSRIAGTFQTRFYTRSFDNFSAQKNDAIRRAQGEWLLLLDADEQVTPELQAEILEILQNPLACDGYYLKRHNYFFGGPLRYGANRNDWQLRLIRRGKGTFEGLIHERIVLQGKAGYLQAPLLHYTSQNFDDYFRRMVQYTSLEAEKVIQQGLRPTWFHIALKPLLQFIYFYFFRLGFLDGMKGLEYQILSSFYTAIKYIKARDYSRQKSS